MDPGVRKGVCKAEGVSGQSTSVLQARVRCSTPSILRSQREGDQFGPIARARSGAEADLFHQQGVARAEVRYQALEKAALVVVFSV